MEKKRLIGKTVFGFGTGMAMLMAVLAAFIYTGVADVMASDQLKEASYCSFVIPPEFVPGSEKGQFINKNYPMESSLIRYSYFDNGLDELVTNREKQTKSQEETVKVTDKTENLTKEIYEETLAEAYNAAYGQNVGYSVSSFDKIRVDGYPGFKIEASYKAGDEVPVHQTVYMLLSKYRTFTVTYQRAEDDECEEHFNESSATIHVH